MSDQNQNHPGHESVPGEVFPAVPRLPEEQKPREEVIDDALDDDGTASENDEDDDERLVDDGLVAGSGVTVHDGIAVADTVPDGAGLPVDSGAIVIDNEVVSNGLVDPADVVLTPDGDAVLAVPAEGFQNVPRQEGVLDATVDEQLRGIVAQVRADAALRPLEDPGVLLAQRLSDSPVKVGETLYEELLDAVRRPETTVVLEIGDLEPGVRVDDGIV